MQETPPCDREAAPSRPRWWFPGAWKARQQNRRLDLRRGDLELVMKRQQGIAACHGEGKAARRCGRGNRAPISSRGSMTRLMGRRESDLSPHRNVVKGVSRRNPAQQPHAGSGIPQIENIIGFLQSRDATSVDAPHPASVTFDMGAQQPDRRSCRQNILALKQSPRQWFHRPSVPRE